MFVYLSTQYAAIVNFLLPCFVYLKTQNPVRICMSRKLFLQYEKLGILCILLGWIHEVFMVKKQKQSNKHVFYYSLTFLKKVICIPTVKNKLYEYEDPSCETEDSEEYDESQDESTTGSIPSTSKSKKICSIY